MEKQRNGRKANDKFFQDQKARAEAINLKVQGRIDDIKKREAAAEVKRNSVKMFNVRVLEEEKNSVGERLLSIDTRLMTSVEKTKANFAMRTIAPKKHNFFIQDSV